MGRPTKIEGNPEHPASLGATDVLTQAAVLGLYDPDRAQTVTYRGEVRPWGAFQAAIQSALGAQKATPGRGAAHPDRADHLARRSPKLLATVLQEYPQARWHQYDPVAVDGARAGVRQATGSAGDAVYHFGKADVIVSLEADFLGCGAGSVRYTRDFADRRRVTDTATEMNRLYVVESSPTLTGAKAEHRLRVRASESTPSPGTSLAPVGARRRCKPVRPSAATIEKWVAAVAKDLQASPRPLPGHPRRLPAGLAPRARARDEPGARQRRRDGHLRAVDRAATGRSACVAARAGDGDGRRAGAAPRDPRQQPGVHGAGGPQIRRAAQRKSASSSITASINDETSNLSHWTVPRRIALETWGDPRAYDGTVTIMQPLIAPLYDAHSAHEVLAR